MLPAPFVTIFGLIAGGACGFAAVILINRYRAGAAALRAEIRTLREEAEVHRRDDSRRHVELLQLRRSQHDLEQGEQFSRAVFEASLAGLLVVDPHNGQIMDANQAAADILGCDADDLIGDFRLDDLGLARAELIPDQATTPGAGPVAPVEGRMRRADGTPLTVLRSIGAIARDDAELVVVGFVDITQRRAAEAELRSSHAELEKAHADLGRHKDQIVQSEKLASIGQLAAGVAHEINNPIGFVTSNLGTIREYFDGLADVLRLYAARDALPEQDTAGRERLSAAIAAARESADVGYVLSDLGDVIGESLEGVSRVADIVQNLKSFAREDSAQAAPYDINETIEAMIRMSWNELKYRCEVVRELNPVPPLTGHAGQISQVIMNMLVNAAQAMTGSGGLIAVGTEVVDDEVQVTIADNGDGIAPEALPRIFDPFYTTKEVGAGTGLGLSISHGIITEHGGRISVDSTLGTGTTFTIRLPLTPLPDTAAAADPGRDPAEELIG